MNSTVPNPPILDPHSPEDLHDVHTMLGAEDVERLKLKAAALRRFIRAKDKRAAAEEIRRTCGSKLKGISLPSLYRMADKYAASGCSLRSLMDGRMVRRLQSGGLAGNKEFLAYWHELCLRNKRATAPAYRELFYRLKAGEAIPGFGTWQDIFSAERGGIRPSPDRACPYEPGANTPKGWTLRNLTRLKPDEFALVAMRKGMMKATMEKLPDIRRTRAGLKCCRIVQFDDMWYEHKVSFGSNRSAQRVVEYAMIDVATGYVFAYLPKPVLEREDGRRETLRSVWTRYCYAYLLGTVGIPEEGVLIMGENGTASADNDLRVTLASVSGGRIEFSNGRETVAEEGCVRFGAGGILTKAIEKGFYDGQGHGNPRYKGMLEGYHGLLKNELAAVLGHMGGGRDERGEYVYGMERHDEQLRAIARALEPTRPGIFSRLKMPFLDFFDFRAIIDLAYARLNNRTEHRMEGWEQQGFMLPEFWNAASCSWVPVESVRQEPEVIQQAIYNAIQAGKVKVRKRRLSPAEAWSLRDADHKKVLPPSVIALEVMGPQLCRTCLCTDKLQMKYRDPSTLCECWVNGIVDGGIPLERGVSYQVWINPFEPLKAFVADMQGKYIGTAKVQSVVSYDDMEGIKREMAVRQAAIAAERKKVQPALNRMLRQRAADTGHNATVILGEDPARVAAEKAAAVRELSRVEAAEGVEFGAPAGDAAAAADVDFGDGPAADGTAEVSAEELSEM